jgi:lipopolysaccharide/colanic/teichoic acid biosynthesis glycosyltransferase
MNPSSTQSQPDQAELSQAGAPLLALAPAGHVEGAAVLAPVASPRLQRATDLADAAATRALDVGVAVLLLLALLPAILLLVVLVKLESHGPAFFRAERVGYGGRTLRMLKFRKMHDGASGPALTVDDDHRFTRIGRFLAATKLDELPQLWHVVVGDMSLVGPRPETPEFVEQHSAAYERILSVRPGITGLSQLAFAEESRILDDEDPLAHYVGYLLPQKISLDRIYADGRSFWTNLRILLWTAAAVLLRRQVAVHRDTGRTNLRRRS